jgi:hypothetical protein
VTAPSNAVLADLARAEAERHPLRSAERRAAAHLWAGLITSPTVSAARSAVATFGTAETQAAALGLLGRLATSECL